MDARSFQQHSARVAEMTDVLLAERAAAKALTAEAAQPAKKSSSSSDSPSSQTSPSQSPARLEQAEDNHPSLLPGMQHGSSSPQQDHDLAESLTTGYEPAQPTVGSPGLAADSASNVLRGAHYCSTCNVSTTSALHLQTHYMGAKHQRRIAQTQDEDAAQHNPLHCSACGITATSEVHLQLHLHGRAHQRKGRLACEGRQDNESQRNESQSNESQGKESQGTVSQGTSKAATTAQGRIVDSRDPSPTASEEAVENAPDGVSAQPSSQRGLNAKSQQAVADDSFGDRAALHHSTDAGMSGTAWRSGSSYNR